MILFYDAGSGGTEDHSKKDETESIADDGRLEFDDRDESNEDDSMPSFNDGDNGSLKEDEGERVKAVKELG